MLLEAVAREAELVLRVLCELERVAELLLRAAELVLRLAWLPLLCTAAERDALELELCELLRVLCELERVLEEEEREELEELRVLCEVDRELLLEPLCDERVWAMASDASSRDAASSAEVAMVMIFLIASLFKRLTV